MIGELDGIGVGELEDAEGQGGLTVDISRFIIEFGPKLHATDVLNPYNPSISLGPDNDVAKLLYRLEAPKRGQGELKHLPLRRRFLSERTCSHNLVLIGDGGRHILGCNAEARHLLGVEPNAHREGALSEHLQHADAGNAIYDVEDVNRDVVADEERVVTAVRRIEIGGDRDIARLLRDSDAGPDHFVGQLGRSDLDIVLHVDGCDIEIVARLEGHCDRRRAVVGAHR